MAGSEPGHDVEGTVPRRRGRHFSADGVEPKDAGAGFEIGQIDTMTQLHRRTSTRLNFVLVFALILTSPAYASWDSFEIIEWQPRDAARAQTLKRLGVTAVAVIADRDGTGTPLEQQTAAARQTGLRWYIENIATDFYASYHRYTPGRPVNWRFLEAQERYRIDPDDETALFREPSLQDQTWRTRIAGRLTETVTQQKSFRPLYYSLGDETGIADLSAYWDFDHSPQSIAGFRGWLRDQYGSLAALNAEWGTGYTDWNSIDPETTRKVMRRTDENFAPWNDFKAWMDTSFADALRFGTNAVHRADPRALSAIEGVQVPGWGGYDYAKLARAVDVMEIYDGEENLPLVRSINPGVVPLITSFGAAPADLHGIWRSVLRGARGLILWDEDAGIVRPDALPGPRAAAYAPLFAALRGEVGRRLIDAEPVYDPVAILYSPTSFRVNWILDHRRDGDAWMHRSAEVETQDNAWRVSLREYTGALRRMGLHPRFVTEDALARGTLAETVLILPHGIALPDQDVRAIAAFAAKGGRVIADVPPGEFDGHGRRRALPVIPATIVSPHDLPRVLTLTPAFGVEGNDVETYLFRSKGQRLLALQRGTPGQTAETVTIDLHGRHARDIATGRDYGRQERLTLELDPVAPTLLEIGR
jgi:hypothetical protein